MHNIKEVSMKRVLVFLILLMVKILSQIFYRFEYFFLGEEWPNWKDVRLVVLLNHTSLYEPLFLGLAPIGLLWNGASRFLVPGADKTLDRTFVGWFYKSIVPKMVSISRKRDHTWDNFLSQIGEESMILMAPEGRMMRETGLDKNGKEMSIKTGIVDILKGLKGGKMILLYSGGLHHVQVPGQRLPKLFKTLKMNVEIASIVDYKSQFLKEGVSDRDFRKAVIEDLEKKKKEHCPK